MNEVQAIKSVRHINRIKKALHGRNKLLFIVGINSGLRVSDILPLRVKDLRDKDYVDIIEKKTGKRKRFALNAAIKKASNELIEPSADSEDFVFKSRKGNGAIGRVQAYIVLNAAVERAGLADKLGKIGTHSMRKTFGYFAHKNGTDITLLMRIFNHRDQRETMRYLGIEQDDIDAVYAKVNL
ncbi:site-specific recombinase, phage integrase family [Geomicrobium sp. JCM 19037]|uniref:tyrosine-type recombinase/integrase n=1 Tax=Geomicrobium sp. JCM 19037 TaxID=1460634 RepID=UPI00045F2C09|nr:tyrosine-type recombinase/integrase [Geomicrobium sp. JCM 19037]GAK03267.1 site-specific recombinase, phage integrase family [Geomicrobium sp. JCM 19037]